jgi:hypothetical protein
MLLDPDGLPLDVGRQQRVVPPHDGDTSLDSSALLCERHHTKVHHGYHVERDDGAPPEHRWRTHRPDGTEIRIQPYLLAA